MTLPPITDKQTEILFYLYKFRFLSTHHFQKLLNHKNPKRIQLWLKDLKDKHYITTFPTNNTFTDNNKPYIYHLATKARHILKKYDSCDITVLEKVYKEKTRKPSFVTHCLTLADVYLFFLSQKKDDETLYFLTESDLAGYEHLPEQLPSAYIALKTKKETKRYFFELFYPYATAGVLRYRFRAYLKYANSGTWEANEENKSFPAVLFVCPSNRLKNHLLFYAKGVFEKSYEEKINLYVTTENILLHGDGGNIWEKVGLRDES
jgi:hypothetical protein